MVGADGRAGPLGRRVPGLGRARRLPRDRPRRRAGPACCGCRPSVLRELVDAWFPFGGAPRSRASTAPRASIESTARQRECAGHARARWPPGSPTRSTTRPRPRPGRSTRSSAACDDAARRRSRRLARRRRSRPRSSPRSTRCAARSSPPTALPDPLGTRRPRGGAVGVAGRVTASSAAWTLAPPLAAAGVDVGLVRAGGGRARRAGARSRRWSGWRSTLAVATLLGEVQGVDAARSPSWSAAVRSYSQMDRGVACSGSTSPRAREHAGDARATSCATASRWCATTARDVPLIEAYAGRAQPGVDQPRSTTPSTRWTAPARCGSRPASTATRVVVEVARHRRRA